MNTFFFSEFFCQNFKDVIIIVFVVFHEVGLLRHEHQAEILWDISLYIIIMLFSLQYGVACWYIACMRGHVIISLRLVYLLPDLFLIHTCIVIQNASRVYTAPSLQMYVRIAIISCGMNVITTFFVQGRLLSFDLDCVHLCLLCEICIDYALGKIMGC